MKRSFSILADSETTTAPQRPSDVLKAISLNQITPPTTPKKLKPVGPSQHTQRLLDSLTPPVSPHRPTTPYTIAKGLFNRGGAVTHTLAGRAPEAALISEFLTSNITLASSASLYIYGPPGTGKTAQVNQTLGHLLKGSPFTPNHQTLTVGKVEHSLVVVKINCFIINKPESIFREISLKVLGKAVPYEDLKEGLEQAHLLVVIILDELDSLITKDQQILYQLFKMASKNAQLTSTVLLVGIANALDLTDRLLPRLKTNGLSPQTVAFRPYTTEQMKEILVGKLAASGGAAAEALVLSAGLTNLVHPMALLLCAKKCCSSGDLRKAFDVMVKAIEFAEAEAKVSGQVVRVTMSHVSKVFQGSGNTPKVSRLNGVQQCVVACMVNSTKMRGDGVLTNDELYDHYCGQVEAGCRRLGKLGKGEFLEILSNLEAGCVVVGGEARRGAGFGGVRMRLNVDFDETVGVLEKVEAGVFL